jgi:hypothetical protein
VSDFTGYRCWTITALNETAMKDAVAPKAAVFLATHHPARIRRRPLQGGGRPINTDEQELLNAFSIDENPELMLMPIVGDSGTGKSHLVRWLHAHLHDREGWKVVYVPKYETNLRSIVRLVLEGMEGDEFDAARKALDRASDENIDEDKAPDRLLNELAVQIGDAPDDGENPEHRTYLKENLPVLLHDPVFRKRLLADGGVIRRLVGLALHGRQVDDDLDDDSGQFGIEDLPLSATDVVEASKDAQEAFRYLSGDQTMRQTAVDVLNERLEAAESMLFVSADLRVGDVLLDVRRSLLERGLELVLFIEDLTVLHGVQQELLNSLVVPAQDEFCKLRAAMAVTSGYFDALDTVKTRCDHAYDLDLPYGEEDASVSTDDAVDFVSRYLNAARLGASALEEAHDAARKTGSELDTEWVQSACDTCEHKPHCHDGFGSAAGTEFGLYPFNKAALDRMVRAWSPSHFDPRRIVTEVIRHTLTTAEQELPESRFPSQNLVDNYDDHDQRQLSADVAAELHSRDPNDADRRARVLTYWGGAPSEVANLDDALHDAFDLRPLSDVGPPPPPPPPPGPGSGPGPEPELLPKAIQDSLDQLDKWHTGEFELSQPVARGIRAIVHAAVVERLTNGSFQIRVSTAQFSATDGEFFRQSSVDLAKARGSKATKGRATSLHIDATAANAALLRAATLASHHGHWSFERGPERLREWAAAVDEWAGILLESWGTADRDRKDRDEPAAALLYGARAAGLVASDRSPSALLGAALDLRPADGNEERTKSWLRLESAVAHKDRAELREALLNRIGAAKGGGGARAIDASAVLSTIEGVAEDWQPSQFTADSTADRYRQRIEKVLDKACDDELAQLRAWYETVVDHLNLSIPPAQVAPAFRDAVEAAVNAGVLTDDSDDRPADEARSIAAAFEQASLESVRKIGQVLEEIKELPPIDVAPHVAPDRRPDLQVTLDFCQIADRILSVAEATLEARSSVGAEVDTSVSSVDTLDRELERWLGLLQEAEDETC